MTPPDPTIRISASAFRQLLGAASDAGLGSIISTSSVRNDGEHVTITITAREVRALTNWLTFVAESHRDAPITASTVHTSTSSATDEHSWMCDVTDTIRTAPVGYESVNIPTHDKGSN
jgi:hypothetical protein